VKDAGAFLSAIFIYHLQKKSEMHEIKSLLLQMVDKDGR
jgi:hypothetical protein